MASSFDSRAESGLNHASVLIIIAILFALAIMTRAFCIDCCYGRSRRRRNGFDYSDDDLPSMENMGLDKESLEALPMTEYKSQTMNEDLECVVCLSQFEENEKIRVLPKCNHSFHTECINMWLQSHTSCPICRQTLPSNSNRGRGRGREATSSSNIDNSTAVSVVRLHLVRGQRSSTALQHSRPISLLTLMNEALAHQRMHAERTSLHTAINIGQF